LAARPGSPPPFFHSPTLTHFEFVSASYPWHCCLFTLCERGASKVAVRRVRSADGERKLGRVSSHCLLLVLMPVLDRVQLLVMAALRGRLWEHDVASPIDARPQRRPSLSASCSQPDSFSALDLAWRSALPLAPLLSAFVAQSTLPPCPPAALAGGLCAADRTQAGPDCGGRPGPPLVLHQSLGACQGALQRYKKVPPVV
jgi:hypothetical protein